MKQAPDPADWVCVEDFAGYWSGFGFREQTSFSADWSPSLGVVRFSGVWRETPDMPAATEPHEDTLLPWALSHDTHFARRYKAAREREEAHEARSKTIESFYEKGGGAKLTVTVTKPNGETVEVSGPVGIRTAMQAARHVCAGMLRTYGPGTRLTRFKYTPSPIPAPYPYKEA